MTMGAIAAMEAAGKTPGKDIIIASIDGTKDAAQAVADGKIAVLVECNPHFGPKAFDSIVDLADGKPIPEWVVNTDRLFTKDNIASYLPEAF
jgi:ABC-type sugar transport system substrate-binding protein